MLGHAARGTDSETSDELPAALEIAKTKVCEKSWEPCSFFWVDANVSFNYSERGLVGQNLATPLQSHAGSMKYILVLRFRLL